MVVVGDLVDWGEGRKNLCFKNSCFMRNYVCFEYGKLGDNS